MIEDVKYKRVVVYSGYNARSVYEFKPAKSFEELKDYIGECFYLGFNDVNLYTDGRKSKPDLTIKSEDWSKELSKSCFEKLQQDRKVKSLERQLSNLQSNKIILNRNIDILETKLKSLKELEKLN